MDYSTNLPAQEVAKCDECGHIGKMVELKKTRMCEDCAAYVEYMSAGGGYDD